MHLSRPPGIWPDTWLPAYGSGRTQGRQYSYFVRISVPEHNYGHLANFKGAWISLLLLWELLYNSYICISPHWLNHCSFFCGNGTYISLLTELFLFRMRNLYLLINWTIPHWFNCWLFLLWDLYLLILSSWCGTLYLLIDWTISLLVAEPYIPHRPECISLSLHSLDYLYLNLQQIDHLL